ncbi:MAG: cobyric acid synthase [Dehalococcoidia bacterium]|nr:cobyric acid synthase [Dehalococcoidia bacterium]
MPTRAAVLMVQGTASSAGKSFLVAGLCRLLVQEGYRVAPFKSQNMSNNAAVTIEGDEIGRAQAVQAHAARVLPHVDMNPVLLKPEANHRSQVIVMGRPYATLNAAAYQEAKLRIWGDVTAALERLRAAYDVVVIEGAGSPAEINLKARDISNMRVALHAEAPVLLVGDIDRGGVFAHLYGTYHLLEPAEQALVKGFIINKLRGDPSLLEPGLVDIERLTTVPVLGVVPWVNDPQLPEEDSVALDRRRDGGGPFAGVDVAIVRFPRIANFDDFDALEAEADVRVRYVTRADALGEPDLVILPGTKATRDDLAWMRAQGLDAALAAARNRGAFVVGVCGGYQVLGERIDDPAGFEGEPGGTEGLGWLPLRTRFGEGKVTRQSAMTVDAARGLLEHAGGIQVEGYEIHAGETQMRPDAVAARLDDGTPIGAVDASGQVFGCYLHGLFASDAFRQAVLRHVATARGKRYEPTVQLGADAAFDRLADVLRSSLNLPAIFGLIEGQRG